MKCKYCQAEIEKDARFCPNCGRELPPEKRCVKCGELLEEESTFCPYCGEQQGRPSSNKSQHRPQANVPKKGNSLSLSNKWVVLFMALLSCVLVYLLFFDSCTGESTRPELDEEDSVPAKSELIDTVNQQQAAMEQQWVEDSLEKVAKLKSDSLTYIMDSLKKDQEKRSKKAPVASRPSSNTSGMSSNSPSPSVQRRAAVSISSKNLGYATFKGSLRNGNPHDVNGRLIFKSHHLIDSRDPKGRVAEPGDYVIGEFSDGHLVQGIWYDADNQVKGSVIIGK